MASAKMHREAAAPGEVEFSAQTLAKAQSSAGARKIHVNFVSVDPTITEICSLKKMLMNKHKKQRFNRT